METKVRRSKRRMAVGLTGLAVAVSSFSIGIAGLLGWFVPSGAPDAKPFKVRTSIALAAAPKGQLEAAASQTPAPFIPVSVSIPSVGIGTVKVTPEGDPGGVLGVPAIQNGWGWWYGGAEPGTGKGTILMDGHVDWYGYGNGPAHQIWYVKPGTLATVYGPNGEARTYVAVSLQTYLKTSLSSVAGNLFSQQGPERLVIVTCGGSFDYGAGSWNSNVIATFVPVDGIVAGHTAP
ncbi:MAG: class F sortase [Actinomycetota bacterium]|nr:class F sortase [Actinomycetota bacterium]